MGKIMINNKYDYLYVVNLLNQKASEYYNYTSHSWSDEKYDKWYHALEEYEADHENDIHPNSPTQKIGIHTDGKSVHLSKMYSLQSLYSEDQLLDFLNRNKDYQGSYTVEPKLDGLAANVVYKDGELISISTRGDGEIGRDITRIIPYIDPICLPKKIECGTDGYVELRGELIIDYKSYELITTYQNVEYSTPRSLLTSIVNSNDLPDLPKEGKILFIVHGVGSGTTVEYLTNVKLHSAMMMMMMKLRPLGFLTTMSPKLEFSKTTTVKTYDEIVSYFKICLQKSKSKEKLKTSKINVDMDGIVIKIDDIAYSYNLGYTQKYPKGQVALKFNSGVAISYVRDIEYSYSRNGKLTPILLINPVSIKNIEVTRLNGYSISHLKRLKNKGDEFVCRNDGIALTLQGGAVPQLLAFLDERNVLTYPIEIPTDCPHCGSKLQLIKSTNSTNLYCTNYFCSEVTTSRVSHFLTTIASRVNVRDINDDELIRLLVKNQVIKGEGYEILLLSRESFKEKTIDEKIVDVVLKAVDEILEANLSHKLILALGINQISNNDTALLFQSCGYDILGYSKAEIVNACMEFGIKGAKFNNLITYIEGHRDDLNEVLKKVKNRN